MNEIIEFTYKKPNKKEDIYLSSLIKQKLIEILNELMKNRGKNKNEYDN